MTADAAAAAVGGWIDSHCHLQDSYRPGGLDVMEAVAEAAGAGVVGLVCVGTDAETSRQAVALVDEVRTAAATATGVPAGFGAWATVGLHPHDASNGMADVVGVLDEAQAATSPAPWWPWGSADSTTTTTIRPDRHSARPSPPKSLWPRVVT